MARILPPPSARILVQLKHPSIQLQSLLLRSRPGEGHKPGAWRLAPGFAPAVAWCSWCCPYQTREFGRGAGEIARWNPSPYSEEPLIDGLLHSITMFSVKANAGFGVRKQQGRLQPP